MKVMLISLEYPPYDVGGIGTFTYELAKGLCREGTKVVVLASGNKYLSLIHI